MTASRTGATAPAGRASSRSSPAASAVERPRRALGLGRGGCARPPRRPAPRRPRLRPPPRLGLRGAGGRRRGLGLRRGVAGPPPRPRPARASPAASARLGGLEPAGDLAGAAAGVLERAAGGLVLGDEPRGGLGAGVEARLDRPQRGRRLGGGVAGGRQRRLVARRPRLRAPARSSASRPSIATASRSSAASRSRSAASWASCASSAAISRRAASASASSRSRSSVSRCSTAPAIASSSRSAGSASSASAAQPRGGGRLGLRGAGGAGGGEERGGGLGAGGLGVVPVAPEQQRLGPAQRLGDLAVAGRLAGLAGEARELAVERLEHVGDAGEVRLGRAQLQLGLVPALVEAGDAGRLLEDAAARLRPGVDQLRDLALPDQRRRGRPGRGVGEEHRDVAGPRLAPADPVGRAGVAGDPADDRRARRRR